MSVVDMIGWIAALSSASLAVPQGVRIARLRSVAGVAILTWQSLLLAGLAWTAHGLLYGTQQVIWPNLLLTLTAAWVLWQLTVARSLPWARTWLPPIGYAALGFAVDATVGQVAFGIVVFVPGALGQFAQIREILRVPDLSGISMVMQLMGLANQILWFSFAMPSGDMAIVAASVPIGVLYALTIAALAIRRRRLRGATVRNEPMTTQTAHTGAAVDTADVAAAALWQADPPVAAAHREPIGDERDEAPASLYI